MVTKPRKYGIYSRNILRLLADIINVFIIWNNYLVWKTNKNRPFHHIFLSYSFYQLPTDVPQSRFWDLRELFFKQKCTLWLGRFLMPYFFTKTTHIKKVWRKIMAFIHLYLDKVQYMGTKVNSMRHTEDQNTTKNQHPEKQ